MRFTERRVPGCYVLISGIEWAAIRDAPERSGDNLWIFRITEAPKSTVFRTEVVIDTYVELIGVVVYDWVRRVVVEQA